MQVPAKPAKAHDLPRSHAIPGSDLEESLNNSPRDPQTEPGSKVEVLEASPTGSPKAAVAEPCGEVLKSLSSRPTPCRQSCMLTEPPPDPL